MSLSTGDTLAIVFGSILGLLILGYLLYILMFKKKPGVNIMQVKEYLRNNPNDRQQISSYIESMTGSSQTPYETQTMKPLDTGGPVYKDQILTEVDDSVEKPNLDLISSGSYNMTTPVR